ncbi:MAG: glycosyltransferase [Bacteroidota bacterium]|jgi:glycosyltransferase involved in cell wall biosynthesis
MSTNGQPCIAVVMATCNGAAFLEAQLNSLQQQSLQPDLIIICDDASDDHTPQLLEKYTPSSKLIIKRNPQRLGVNENFRQAVALVPDGFYIAFCDQDDIWLPEKLERSLQCLLSLEAGSNVPALVYSDLILIDNNDQILSDSVHRQRGQHRYQHIWDTFLYGNMVSGCTILMNTAMKQVMADLPKTDQYIYDAWLAMAAFGFGRIACMPQPLIHYRQHPSNLTFANHHSRNRIQRWLSHLRQLTGPSDFLREEICLARDFSRQYAGELKAEKWRGLNRLLGLENSSYLRKKLHFEKSFYPYWLNRFS